MHGRDQTHKHAICFSGERQICAGFRVGRSGSDTGTRESWVRELFPPPFSPLKTSDAALTRADFSLFSKGFAGTDRTS